MSITTVATRGMLFCPEPPMKRLSWSLLVVVALALSAVPAPGSSVSRRRDALSAPRRRSRHTRPDDQQRGGGAPGDATCSSGRSSASTRRSLPCRRSRCRGACLPTDSSTSSTSTRTRPGRAASPVTSDDVRFTIERIRDPKVNAVGWSSGFDDLASVETPDPRTVRVRFQKPYAERLLAFGLPIVSAAAYGQSEGARRDVTAIRSAAVPTASNPGNRTGRSGWFDVPRLRRSRPSSPRSSSAFCRTTTPGTRPERAATSTSSGSTATRRKRPRRRPTFLRASDFSRCPSPSRCCILWNCREPFLADARVRRALAQSWPRQERRYASTRPRAPSSPRARIPRACRRTIRPCPPPPYDPAQSARLLDEAGWKKGRTGSGAKAAKKASVDLLCPGPGPDRHDPRPRFSETPTRRSAFSSWGSPARLGRVRAARAGRASSTAI